jgi:hypothetical protein
VWNHFVYFWYLLVLGWPDGRMALAKSPCWPQFAHKHWATQLSWSLRSHSCIANKFRELLRCPFLCQIRLATGIGRSYWIRVSNSTAVLDY